jgi:tight adherence protein B
MEFSFLQILSATVFLAVLLLIVGIHRLYVDGMARRHAATRRLRSLADRSDPHHAAAILLRKPRDRITLLARFDSYLAWLDRLAREAGFKVPLHWILFWIAGLSGLVVVGGISVLGGGGLAGMLAVTLAAIGIGTGLTIIPLLRLRARRIARFTAQLPEALDIMVRSLRAGHPVNAAMGLVSREVNEPLGIEFGIAVDEMTYGLDLREALANLAQRIAVPDLQYLAIAIRIQHETGGNLAEVLQGLNAVIRARFRMLKKARALSAEGRLSARVLAAMPFVFAGLIFLSRPEFYLSAVDDPLFFPIVGAAVGLELVGILIMHRMVNFHV